MFFVAPFVERVEASRVEAAGHGGFELTIELGGRRGRTGARRDVSWRVAFGFSPGRWRTGSVRAPGLARQPGGVDFELCCCFEWSSELGGRRGRAAASRDVCRRIAAGFSPGRWRTGSVRAPGLARRPGGSI